MSLVCRSEHRCFGGTVGFWSHDSLVCRGPMRFAVYVPPQAAHGPVPVLYFLAGLTCTEENFMVKAGAQAWAAAHGLMLVAPDTSPRQTGIPGEDDTWDLGSGAGFYVDATAQPWAAHYQMYSYVVKELPELIEAHFPAHPERRGIFGHSMGGHGALVCALRNPDRYQSLSAFAPIVAPSLVPWGQKVLASYLGPDPTVWAEYDACALVRRQPFGPEILIDQGTSDPYLTEQLQPERFQAACAEAGQALTLRYQARYDHGYYGIATFIGDHLAHHAQALLR